MRNTWGKNSIITWGGLREAKIDEPLPEKEKIEIDLTGPDGNAFNLLSVATELSKFLEKDDKEITARMMSGDYENLLQVFDEEFSSHVLLIGG